MDSFYSLFEIEKIGLKSFGSNVKISKKASIYGANNIEVGNNVRIDDFCILSGKISIGNNVHIAAYSALYGGEEGIIIGDFCNISSRVSIYSKSDDYSGETLTSPVLPDELKRVISKTVYIERHSIIGASSVIMPGIVIRIGSSFGAFSFINRDSEPWSINVGIPFRKIKNRSKNLLELEKEYLAHNGEKQNG